MKIKPFPSFHIMPTLLLHFANGEGNKFLKTLRDEFDGINKVLLNRASKGDFGIVADQFSSREKMIDTITCYEKEIILFLFSGHAGPEQLSLTDGDAYSDGIARLLGKCKKLDIVILNGCSTAAQVKALLDNDIPVVIATSARIGDETATRFSISFFEGLSLGSSIRDAFNQSIEKARVYGKIEGVEITSRGLVTSQEKADTPLWGLYFNKLKKDFLDDWRLPDNTSSTDQSGVNNEIRESLLGISEKYEVEASKEKMLALLPYLISEPIRKLLTPKEGTGIFYDSPSKDRFKMLLFAYRAIINLASYSLLAQLWDEGLNNHNKTIINGDCQKLFTSSFFKENEPVKHQSRLKLLRSLLQVMKEEHLVCFIEEMGSLLDTLNQPNTKNALADLESKLYNERELLTAPDLLNLCLETECSLAKILFDFGFMINYSLTSIPNIECLKNQRLKSQVYRHRFLTMRNQADALRRDDEQLLGEFPLDNSSVIIHKHGDRSTSHNLNLSPFLVDKNTFDNTSKPDLHFLENLSPQTNTLYYCPATSYKNHWEVSPEEIEVAGKSKYYYPKQSTAKQNTATPSTFNSHLIKQIESFSSTVLNKRLKEL